MTRRLWVASAAVMLVLGAAASATASIVEALELDQLVDQSAHVVTATAISHEARRDDYGRIVTDVTVRLERVWKGGMASGETLVVRRLGGEIGEIGMRVEGEAVLRAGERYALFLRDRGDHCRPVGMSQGAMPITSAANGVEMVHPGGDGVALVVRSGSQLVPAPPAIMQPLPLDTLQDRVREVVAGRSVPPTLLTPSTGGAVDAN